MSQLRTAVVPRTGCLKPFTPRPLRRKCRYFQSLDVAGRFGPAIAETVLFIRQHMPVLNRRSFLWTGAALSRPAAAQVVTTEAVYRFTAGDCEVRMSVQFFDNYSTRGFWFKEQLERRRFCLSAAGVENHGCLSNFAGAIAIARYHVQHHSRVLEAFSLRERVRTIDQDGRLATRAPFERTIELQDGIASDIQAFGYQMDGSQGAEPASLAGPWCLLRQDLYLAGHEPLFLVLHWKHTLPAIRLFDVIPGEQTRVIAQPDILPRRAR
jgi:hypothetical protein